MASAQPSAFQSAQPEALKNVVVAAPAAQPVVPVGVAGAGAGIINNNNTAAGVLPGSGPGVTPFQYPPNMVFTTPDPNALVDDQPTYVNPKQYARILKRRESRKKQTGTDVTSYTPRKRSYMHESRHKHAMQRRRGPGGRFLSKQERADLNKEVAAAAAAAAGATDTAPANGNDGQSPQSHHPYVGVGMPEKDVGDTGKEAVGGSKET